MSYFFEIAQKSNKFASKRTLDYFQKKYSEYANKRLVSQIERDGERHGSSCRMQYFNNYLTRVIMSQKFLQRVSMMLYYITNFFSRLLAYSGDLTEGSFFMQILSFG